MSGLSGLVASKYYWSHSHCLLHFIVSILSGLGIMVALLLSILDMVRFKMKVHWIKNAWSILPFTISYNELVNKIINVVFIQLTFAFRMEETLDMT